MPKINVTLTERQAHILRNVLFFSSPNFETMYLDKNGMDVVGVAEYAELAELIGVNDADDLADMRAQIDDDVRRGIRPL